MLDLNMTESQTTPPIPQSDWVAIRADGQAFPACWIETVLGIRLTDDQRLCADDVPVYQYNHWRAAHATGKTFLLACMALQWGTCYDDAQIITTAAVGRQVRRQLWGLLPNLYTRARGRGYPIPGEMQTTTWAISDIASAAGFSTNNVDAFTGDHGPHVLYLLDEGQGIEQEIVGGVMTSMQSPESRCIFAGNPVRAEGAFYDAWKSDLWHCRKLPAETHPNVLFNQEIIPGAITRPWIADMAKQYGETSPWFIGRVNGEFPENASFGLFNGGHLASAVNRYDINAPRRGDRIMGIDVAGQGDDLTVWGIRDDVQLRHMESEQIMDPLSVAVRGRTIAKDWGVEPHNIRVDMTGEGHGTVAKFREMGLDVIGVHFGESAEDSNQYANRRAEMYKGAAAAIDPAKGGSFALPDHTMLIEDCRSISYKFDKHGRYQIESKEAIKKRTGRSPDFSDMLALLFYPKREVWVY